MSARFRNILKYLLFIVIGGVLFYLAFRHTEFEKLAHDLRKARYEYVIISMIMGYAAFISRGIRWKYLIQPLGYKTNTWNSIHAVTIGYLTNFLVPRAGELARCTSLHRSDKVPVNRLFGTVVVERLVDFIMLTILIIITISLEYEKLEGFFHSAFSNEDASNSSDLAWKLIVAGIVAGLAIVAWLFRRKFSGYPLYSKAREFYHGFKEGIKTFGKIENKGLFIFHTVFIWAMYFGMAYIVVFALESTEHIDPGSGLFIMIVGALGIIVPSPGGVGSYHYLVMLSMGVIGIAAADAISYATIAHTGQTIMTLISGLISLYALDRVNRRRKSRNLTEMTEDGQT